MFDHLKKKYGILIVLLAVYSLWNVFFGEVVLNQKVIFTIYENESLKSLSSRLEEAGLVKSSTFLRAYLSFHNKDRKVQLGEYEFSGPLTLFSLAREITDIGPKNPLLSVTIPEGSTSLEVFQLFAKVLPTFSKDTFLLQVEKEKSNGFLFPSTYYLLPSYSEETVIGLMKKEYEKRVRELFTQNSIPSPLVSERDVVVLASILEGEANTKEDMKIVAGILLERLRIGMPLQVDVAKETYKTKGLPKEPISNPGTTAITSVLSPTKTEYLYYITGNDGKMYYAKTFNEHKRNVQKYLRQ